MFVCHKKKRLPGWILLVCFCFSRRWRACDDSKWNLNTTIRPREAIMWWWKDCSIKAEVRVEWLGSGAHFLNLPRTTVHKWERGQRKVTKQGTKMKKDGACNRDKKVCKPSHDDKKNKDKWVFFRYSLDIEVSHWFVVHCTHVRLDCW